ncbi:EGF-like repeat and discoidin I-like domain-containing protein 3 [Acropora cervicornis]|uniref:EGF-like repeat and discoidin I-like domain-containing protein 3 n=1 Tax=Acropora cervicornis TaxID=6130 RepID=A0AAD9QU56_ACRCE|nr:EGF-like repeat and discoidin I-like domain-containing protein 3 [Acropora cervicornis]
MDEFRFSKNGIVYLPSFMLVFPCLAHQSKSLIIEGDRGLRRAWYGENVFYVYFVLHQDQYLRGTPLRASLEVASPSECMLECLNNHECFSFNIASAFNERKTLRCEILSEDKYRNAKDLIDSQVYQHYSIKTPCLSLPCKNGGTCVAQYEDNRFKCVCSPGYTDFYCATDINECLSSPCQNGATCSDEVNKYSCICQAGYSGYNCQTDINECLSSPCQNGATCSDEVNKYSCTCQVGYIGYNCQTACQAPLGMQNRRITAAQISASSYLNSRNSPDGARLFNLLSISSVGCWSAASNNLNQWIQIDLRTKTRVTQVATQGRPGLLYKRWVTRYKLLFSDDGNTFQGFVAQVTMNIPHNMTCGLVSVQECRLIQRITRIDGVEMLATANVWYLLKKQIQRGASLQSKRLDVNLREKGTARYCLPVAW